jgi:tetratricopeptide (TPR) repeat protein
VQRVAKEYAWNYKLQPENTWDELFLLAKLKGVQVALQRYDELKLQAGAVTEQTLNTMGYLLLYGGREMDGLRVFRKNVQEYPQSPNAYDSLGEAYMKTGQKDLSIQNYEKSLQLNPKNDNAIRRLKKLRGEAM